MASAYELPFETASVDVVVMSDVLEHFHDIPRALLEAPEEALASAHGVESYPTLLWFDDDASPPRTYRGGRTRADIAAWVSRRVRSGAASEAIDNVEEARA